MKFVTTSPGGWWVVVGGWTKTKLMLFSTQVEVVVELTLELSSAIIHSYVLKQEPELLFPTTTGNRAIKMDTSIERIL